MVPGDLVQVEFDGRRTGVFLGVVEDGESFGLYKIKLNFISGDPVLVRPEGVKLITDPELEAMLR